ncbi:uncharacterized protein EI97DRAFT_448208 [Westerdykella ornata]|uniref:Zn(2)-C6 fungal-type domain-containing protein n=1 Tax=Westerdykella ornata TaxID=318751 RepID=A0A6A6JUF8_WESOR|nr:uncharacterized protein EI97DRAFT_448208 [Westerdykella ornata]KAF2279458.1 hypothetical protein EI97DRAFT_448208 [Westerdykella ornata]
MADQNPPHSLPPSNAYPSPHSYPSPSMQLTYTYPPPQGQSNQEAYRGSPQGTNLPLPPLNLPPIRLQDGQVQQSSQQPPMPQPMPSPHPPPQHHMPQYYHAAHPQPVGMGVAPHLQMRYALPPQGDHRILSGGRNKKEVKRRTKTGCLTCRKRRIKCDEAHPVCRNCQKSKRECAGYDPIFKQQPGPAQIQPAPGSASHQTPAPASSPSVSSSYSGQVPHGYAPAVSAGYVPPATGSGPSHQPHENFSHPAIDPALASENSNMQGGQPAYNGAHALNPVLRDVASSSPFTAPTHAAPVVKGQRLKITDLFAIAGHPPPEVPPRQAPISQELDDEFATMFAKDYCQGLDAILETNWFSTNNNALRRIMADKNLREEAIFFVETCNYRRNSSDMSGIFSQEARLIWHMLSVCKHAPPATNGTNGTASAAPEDDDMSLKEVRARFDILEALLTNEVLHSNPLYSLHYPAELPTYRRQEIDFWRELGNFVVHDNDSPPPSAADYALSTMRALLGQETRDALYSISIARRLGNRIGGFPNSVPVAPPNLDPENDLSKLTVAMGHISYECRSSTQQVIARICDMAMLSWTASRKAR